MGICESNYSEKYIMKPKHKKKQPFHAPIRSVQKFDNNYSLSTLSQTDIISIKKQNHQKRLGFINIKEHMEKKKNKQLYYQNLYIILLIEKIQEN